MVVEVGGQGFGRLGGRVYESRSGLRPQGVTLVVAGLIPQNSSLMGNQSDRVEV